ncbi:MAG: hypothetical protein L0H93_19130 [Nocardioides sp.]|nr:hypothetical protein [Nocardioides sp.]
MDLRTARSSAAAALRVLRSAESAQTNDADPETAWETQRSGRVELHTARAAAAAAVRNLEETQRVYDSTPAGQRELAARLATAENPPDDTKKREDPQPLRQRLAAAEEHHAAVMTRWRASSAYTEERLGDLVADHRDNPREVADRIRDLRAQIVTRRATEHGVLPPPTHPKARAAWERAEPRGRTWRAVADLTSPAAASLTYSDPNVHEAALGYVTYPEAPELRDELLSAHARSLPAALAPQGDPTHHMYRANATGKPWTVEASTMADMVTAKGARRVDPDGDAAHGGRPGDQWRVLRVVGPVQVTGGATPVAVESGTLCVRVRDGLWRALPTQRADERLEVAQHATTGP